MSAQDNINSLLANLTSNSSGADRRPYPMQPGPPLPLPPFYAQNGNVHPQPPPAYNPQYPPAPATAPAPPAIPVPTGSGTVNLYDVRPSNSGSVNLGKPSGQTSYYPSSPQSAYPARRSRSRSPRRAAIDPSRNGVNSYRAERGRNEPSANYVRELSPRGRDSPDSRYSPLTGRRVTGSAPSNGASITQTIAIEASSVGLVIGRSGENMRRLESSTRTRIQFAPPEETVDGMRKCTITGSRESIEEAITEIQKTMDDHDRPRGSGRGPPATGRNSGPENPSNGQRDAQSGKDINTRTIMVPSKTVGLIIGKRGDSIKEIQDRSHCHVNIMGEDQNVNGFRPVHLIGTGQQAALAERIIMDIVHNDAKALPHEAMGLREANKSVSGNPRNSNEKLTVTIRVPSEAVGMIIGKGGEAVRDMQDTTNCKINVSQPSGRDIEREIELIGSNYSIQQAEAAIQEKVRAVQEKNARLNGPTPRNDSPQLQTAPRDYVSMPAQPVAADTMEPPGGHEAYAAYGGYQNYVALWYATQGQQAQQTA